MGFAKSFSFAAPLGHDGAKLHWLTEENA